MTQQIPTIEQQLYGFAVELFTLSSEQRQKFFSWGKQYIARPTSFDNEDERDSFNKLFAALERVDYSKI